MRTLARLPEPPVLAKNKAEWTKRFLAKRAATPGVRPPSSQYRHAEIVRALEAMSFHKCFYCEQSVKDSGHEIDHAIEIEERPELAFEWRNLYLACRECNDKLSNRDVPIAGCVDPCDGTHDPAAHLTFDDEMIRPRDASARGAATIRKYRLDRLELDYKRLRQLKYFADAVKRLLARMVAEGRKTPSDEERELLRSFASPEHPFSLMFEVYLRNNPV